MGPLAPPPPPLHIWRQLTSLTSEGKLNGIAPYSTKGIDDEVTLTAQGQVLGNLLWGGRKPALCRGQQPVQPTCTTPCAAPDSPSSSRMPWSKRENSLYRWDQYLARDPEGLPCGGPHARSKDSFTPWSVWSADSPCPEVSITAVPLQPRPKNNLK